MINQSASDSPTSRKKLTISAQVVLLTLLLLAVMLGTQLYAIFGLKSVNRVVDAQSVAVEEQVKDIANQTASQAAWKTMREIGMLTESVRYWLTDLSLSLQMDSERKAESAQKQLDERLNELAKTDETFVQQLRPLVTAYGDGMLDSVDAYSDNNRVLGNSLVAEGRQRMGAIAALLDERLTVSEAAAREATHRVQVSAESIRVAGGKVIAANHSMSFALIVLLAVAFLLSFTAAYFVIRRINRALRSVAAILDQGADRTAATAAQVSASSQSLAEGASEQAASLEETSSSLEEMSSIAKLNAKSATAAKELSNQTRAAADTGVADMTGMKQAMDAIQESSADISNIIKTIDEIAFQTNILALNAAVEAARAGEAGAGFAVVAEEVRNLAQRSAHSAKETASKIEDSVSKSEHGVSISAKVAESLQLIVERARKMDTLVVEIADSSNEQTQSISQVNIAVTQMDTITQGNAGSSEETAAASRELSFQATAMLKATAELRQLVGYESKQPSNESPIHEPKSSSNTPDGAFVDWEEPSSFRNENDNANRLRDTIHETQTN